MRGWTLLLLLIAAPGCSDGATARPLDDALSSDATDDVADASAPDGPTADTSAADAGDDGATADTSRADTTVADAAKPDTGGPLDVAVGEAGGTLFPCGKTTCSSAFQYCSRARGPGICPAVDAGVCPAGCPGCPALPLTCETMPTTCWAKPSCACLLVAVCGSATAGTCTESGGGFTVGCLGA